MNSFNDGLPTQAPWGSDQILRPSELAEMLGISKSTLWARLKVGDPRYDPDFPRPFPLHDNISGKGAVGFLKSEVTAYIIILKERALTC